MTKTMVHVFIDSYNIYDLQNSQINIARAEGYIPLGIFQDKYSTEMSFPSLTLWIKTSRQRYKKLYISKYCAMGGSTY